MLKLRAAVLVTLGTPAMAALIVGIGVTIFGFWGTSLLDGGFRLGALIFGALSLIALGLILRVRRRVVETGDRSPLALLARFSPVLMLAGAIAGAVLAQRMVEQTLRSHHEFMADECRAFVGEGRDIEACLPLMERCDAAVRGTDGITVDRRGKLSIDWPEGLTLPSGPRTRARFLCVWRALEKTSDDPGDAR